MTPYVACMLVATGMLAHFGVILVRFLRRRAEEASIEEGRVGSAHQGDRLRLGTRIQSKLVGSAHAAHWPALANGSPRSWSSSLPATWPAKRDCPSRSPARCKSTNSASCRWRTKAASSRTTRLARNSLQILSGQQELECRSKDGKVVDKSPAILWLLDAISDAKAAGDHQIFRVENLDLLDTLGLEHRPLFWRYSLNEIQSKDGELRRQIELAEATPEKDRSLFQNKVLRARDKYNFYLSLVLSFRQPPISRQTRINSWRALERARTVISRTARRRGARTPCHQRSDHRLDAAHGGRFPHAAGSGHQSARQPGHGHARPSCSRLRPQRRGDFNKQVGRLPQTGRNYETVTVRPATKQLKDPVLPTRKSSRSQRSNFEVFFNQFSPFYYAAVLYVVAFVLGVAVLDRLDGAVAARLDLAAVVHVRPAHVRARRPHLHFRPAAGHQSVLLGHLHRLGRRAAGAGVRIDLPARPGQHRGGRDRLPHAARGHTTSRSTATRSSCCKPCSTRSSGWPRTWSRSTSATRPPSSPACGVPCTSCSAHVFPGSRTTTLATSSCATLYGTLCFAIFFSFVGTVLGGLWADDSWGRFWGWDPKENGALIIVLWNALVLHARWGGLVKGRGLATLAVGGNIVTTWSWFGVNELGVGLHAYGASESSTAMWLLDFRRIATRDHRARHDAAALVRVRRARRSSHATNSR